MTVNQIWQEIVQQQSVFRSHPADLSIIELFCKIAVPGCHLNDNKYNTNTVNYIN